MQLISSPASPFVRKVRVTIHELNLGDAVTEVPVTTTATNPAPEALAANPTGKIPALIREGGPAIYDSRVITRFLNDFASADLYPQARLWEVLTLEATADALAEAAVLMVYEKRLRPEEKWHEPWIEAQWSKVTGALGAIESRWMSHLAGPLDAAQIAVACACGYLDFRHGDRGWRALAPELSAWATAFAERPSMVATAPE